MNLGLRSDDPAAASRYTVVLLVVVILAAGVFYLIGKALAASHQSHQAIMQTQQLREQTREIKTLGEANSSLITEVASLEHRLAVDEQQTCTIQSRGLESQPYLVGSLTALHELLEFPPTRAQRRAERQLPARRRRRELADFGALNSNLASYIQIVSKQPPSRTC